MDLNKWWIARLPGGADLAMVRAMPEPMSADDDPTLPHVDVVGGGLAGCECAWQLATRGVAVTLHEMKPHRRTAAQDSDRLAELVCSNSFRSDNPHNAVGLLHEELRTLGSLILRCADEHRVPAGDALAVDRERFSAAVEDAVRGHPRIAVRHAEVSALAFSGPVVVATGPLTTDGLAAALVELTGRDRLAFYDAIAPIVAAESIDRERVFAASRWGKGGGDDYLNCPLDRARYADFVAALVGAETLPLQEFEKGVQYFPGCLPVEVIAASGPQSLRFGPMKPTGLVDPRTGRWPWAVVQLRAENRARTAYNLVGFQTKMRQGDQRRVIGMVPGLADAEFLRYGSVHRNTFVDGPRVLDAAMRVRACPQVRLAGQVTGVEGYVESTASGLWVGWSLAAELGGRPLDPPPATTALGALIAHVVVPGPGAFQPSNLHFGLFDPPAVEDGVKRDKAHRKQLLVDRARRDLAAWCSSQPGAATCG